MDGLRDLRCGCGRLLARISGGGRGIVQIRCKGCHALVQATGDRVEIVEQGEARYAGGQRQPVGTATLAE
ncbi:MAG: hypothetical protein KGK07_07480 [Chloroflexota bacterium]|nr:hypothetical protein [Chloroflexota bacterium]